jgi:hypothetical protein
MMAGSGAMGAEVMLVELAERRIQPGVRTVIVSVYAEPHGGDPLASETRSVRISEQGTFGLTLGDLAAAASGVETRWLAVRIPPGKESRRMAVASQSSKRGVTVHVVTVAAITAPGLVESTVQGFRFPDGTVQTSAATASGGVPSVNGIGGAVTITGSGTASVQTVGSTITVNAPSFGTPVAIGSANAAGAASTIVRSDHVHAHGDQAGGSLHATATTGSAGFMSATDKQKLDGAMSYVRTIVVSPVVGDSAASGTALLTALNGISGHGSSNPYLVKIEPGVYDIGASALTMKTSVDIEGSGEEATFIVSSRGNSSLTSNAAAIIGAANAELRQLTLTNTAPGSLMGVGFFANSLGVRITNVTISSTGAATNSIGLFCTSSGTVTMSRTTITATAMGVTSGAAGISLSTGAKVNVLNSSVTSTGIGGTGANVGVALTSQTAAVTIDSCTIIATGTGGSNTGVSVAPGTATITNSTIQADTNGQRTAVSTSASASSIANVFHSRLLALATGSNGSELSLSKGTNSTLRVAASQVDSASSGVPKCVHVYDDEMNDLSNVCPAPVL